MIRYGHGMSEYVCPACGKHELRAGRFVQVPENERTYKGEEIRLPEYCSAKVRSEDDPETSLIGQLCSTRMVWTPTAAAHDLLGENFVVDLDGVQTKVSSLRELRTMETLSLRRARNGEGAPIVFRGFSQNRSNRDVNTLRGSEFEKNTQIPFERRTHAGPIRAEAVPETKVKR
jgi:hypothetical protein